MTDWSTQSASLVIFLPCIIALCWLHLLIWSRCQHFLPTFLPSSLQGCFFFAFFFFKKKGTNHEGKGMGSTKWIKLKHINLSLLHFLSFFVFLFLCLILFPYFLFPSIMSTSFPSSSAFYFSYITILIHLLARGFYDFFYLLVITE